MWFRPFYWLPSKHLIPYFTPMKNKVLLIIIAGLAVIYWIILLFRIPVFNVVPDYFWHCMQFIDKPPGSTWLILPLMMIAAIGLWLIYRYREHKGIVVTVLIMLGYTLHVGIGFLGGRGIDGFRARLLTFGHAEFVKLACAEPNLKTIATDYESFLEINPSIRYAPTKPPGQLLFYILSQKVTELVSPSENYQERVLKLSLFISLVWPLLAFLVIWPLYAAARLIFDHKTAIVSGVLYLFVPSVMLVILHLDQVLYPMLFMMTILFALKAGQKSSHTLALTNGIMIYLSLYFSFSLIVVLPISLALMLLRGRDKFRWQAAASSVIGTAAMYGLFYLLFHYDAITRYSNTMIYHQAWKQWQPGISETLKFGLLNPVEFFCWLGLPLAVLFFAALIRFCRNASFRHFGGIQWLPVIIALALAGMALLGQTKGEVARLWIFMIPMICMIAAAEIIRRFLQRYGKMVLYVVALQFVTIMLMKHIQDFW